MTSEDKAQYDAFYARLDAIAASHLAAIDELRKLDPATVITCRICNGTAPEPQYCGCGGTQTVAQAIAHYECELEILDK